MSVADCEGRLPQRSEARPRYPSSLTFGNDGGRISPFGPLGFSRALRSFLRGMRASPASLLSARNQVRSRIARVSPTVTAECQYLYGNIPFEIKRRIEYYYIIPFEPIRWRNQSLPCNAWMMIPGAGSFAPIAGRDSSASPHGRITVHVTGGDPSGSRLACAPGGRARLSESSRASWVTRWFLWPSKPLRTPGGSREFPLDSAQRLIRAVGLKRTFRAHDILSFPAAFK